MSNRKTDFKKMFKGFKRCLNLYYLKVAEYLKFCILIKYLSKLEEIQAMHPMQVLKMLSSHKIPPGG